MPSVLRLSETSLRAVRGLMESRVPIVRLSAQNATNGTCNVAARIGEHREAGRGTAVNVASLGGCPVAQSHRLQIAAAEAKPPKPRLTKPA